MTDEEMVKFILDKGKAVTEKFLEISDRADILLAFLTTEDDPDQTINKAMYPFAKDLKIISQRALNKLDEVAEIYFPIRKKKERRTT